MRISLPGAIPTRIIHTKTIHIRKNRNGRKTWAAALVLIALSLLLLSPGKRKGDGEAPETLWTSLLREGMQKGLMEQSGGTILPLYGFWEETKLGRAQGALPQICRGILPVFDFVLSGDLDFSEGPKERAGESREEAGITEDLIEKIKEENAQIDLGLDRGNLMEETDFVPGPKQASVDLSKLQDFEELVSAFYAIDSTTYIGRDQLEIKKLLSKDMSLKQRDNTKPQILIYHTHSQEAYEDSLPGDASMTVMGVGEHLARILRSRYGYRVLHHTGQYDVESRDYAYSNAAKALEQILALYPDIEVIIDLHRDEVPPDRRLVTKIQGKSMAQFMFFNGLSRTNKTGEIDYLQNPNLDENLAFSFQMQKAANEYYPGITRKIYLKGYRYNMQYRGKTLLIELGAQNNTFEEAWNACEPLAHVLSLVLK